MHTIPLHFWYKGPRQYIHGTDIYNVMLRTIAELHPRAALGAVRMAIHHTAIRQCRLLCGAPGEALARPPQAATQMLVATAPGTIEAWLVEGEEEVTERRPYDEELVETLCTFGPDSVQITGASPYTAIETLVAMNKFLHQRRYRPEAGKWWFARLQLLRPLQPPDAACFRIHFGEDLGGGRLTRSAVFAGGEHLGHIHFAARTP